MNGKLPIQELQHRIIRKTAYAFMAPLAILTGATIQLLRPHPEGWLAAFIIWGVMVMVAVALRQTVLWSVHRDLDELRRRVFGKP